MGSYNEAIRRVLPNAKHVQWEGLRAKVNNNMSERLQGAFRQRTQALRGLDSRRTGQRFLDGWVANCNLFREQEGAQGKAPAVRAKVSPAVEEWADVARAVPGRRIKPAVEDEKPARAKAAKPRGGKPAVRAPKMYYRGGRTVG